MSCWLRFSKVKRRRLKKSLDKRRRKSKRRRRRIRLLNLNLLTTAKRLLLQLAKVRLIFLALWSLTTSVKSKFKCHNPQRLSSLTKISLKGLCPSQMKKSKRNKTKYFYLEKRSKVKVLSKLRSPDEGQNQKLQREPVPKVTEFLTTNII